MNKLIFILVLLLTSNVFAAPDMTFSCSGVESVYRKISPIDIEIKYSDWELPTGYLKQTILITDPTSKNPRSSVNLDELRYVALNNQCAELTELSRRLSNSGSGLYNFKFSYKCGDDKNIHFDIFAYCHKK